MLMHSNIQLETKRAQVILLYGVYCVCCLLTLHQIRNNRRPVRDVFQCMEGKLNSYNGVGRSDSESV